MGRLQAIKKYGISSADQKAYFELSDDIAADIEIISYIENKEKILSAKEFSILQAWVSLKLCKVKTQLEVANKNQVDRKHREKDILFDVIDALKKKKPFKNMQLKNHRRRKMQSGAKRGARRGFKRRRGYGHCADLVDSFLQKKAAVKVESTNRKKSAQKHAKKGAKRGARRGFRRRHGYGHCADLVYSLLQKKAAESANRKKSAQKHAKKKQSNVLYGLWK